MEFTTVGVISGARFGVPMELSSLLLEPGGAVLRVFNPVAGETVRVGLTAAGIGSVLGFGTHGTARVAVTVGGVAGSVAADLVASARMAPGVMLTGYLAASAPNAVQQVGVMAVQAGGVDYLIAARPAGSGIEVFRIEAGQALVRVAAVSDTAETAAVGVSAMATAMVGGAMVVYAASGSEQAITAYDLSGAGALGVVATLGAAEGVPVQGITALKTVEMAGEVWLIAAAAGSSSLTVFRVGGDGALQPVDHVVDELPTRFGGVTALDALAVGGRVFVVAAGADDGISLLTLLPDGRLLHLASFADTTALGLGNVTDLRLSLVGGVLQVVALSGAEAGVTQLSVDLRGLGVVGTVGTAGDDLLVVPDAGSGGAASGGVGRDILLDGAGNDTLTGGAGADVFVLGADAKRDVIADFDIAQDRIDLTAWAFFRNAGQLQITATTTGAVLRFFGEELELRSADGRSLTEAALRALSYGAMLRIGMEGDLLDNPDDRTVTGTAGNDTLTGTAGNDVISGLDGDDVIAAGAGADTVFGGTGRDWLSYAGDSAAVVINLRHWGDSSPEVARDVIDGIEGFIGTGLGDVMTGFRTAVLFRGGAGNDTLTGGLRGGEIEGGEGDDSLTGGNGAEWLWGGAGADFLTGGDSNDSLDGGVGNDRLFGATGADWLAGGAGDDWIEGGDGVDILADGAGNDTLYGGAGDESIVAVDGNDWVYGDAGNDTLEGGVGGDRLFGGIGNDRLGGGDGDDWAEGGDGADELTGAAGNDTGHGGTGDDALWGGAGNDWLNGDDGNDTLDGSAGNDRLSGGAGSDQLGGGDGDDLIEGGDGVDVLADGAGNDTLYGGAGDESIVAVDGNDWVYGDAGNDTLEGGVGGDRLFGGDGGDDLAGGSGDDLLDGGAGGDTLDGGAGDDSLAGGAGNDVLAGLMGDDVLSGGDGDDRMSGGSGDDALEGGAGNDWLSASIGDDTLRGDAGDDVLVGLFGADALYGGAGNDIVDGGAGDDVLWGGAGADVFVFVNPAEGEVDVLGDFEDGVDLLRLVDASGVLDAGGFGALSVRDVTVGAAAYAEVLAGGHVIRLAGVAAADLTAADFLFV